MILNKGLKIRRMQMGFNELTDWIYSDGDLVMLTARILTLVVCMEVFAHIISLITSIAKTAVK